jgi:catechol 2,3-dioxygenase-like lactoylglutathione lyase family enzyme
MRINQLNHVGIHVADVQRSCAFYRDVLGLKEIPRPAFSFDGAWFEFGPRQELHIICGRDQPVVSQPRGNHFALRVPDLAEAEAELRARRIDIIGPQLRPDGVMQLFIRDPDGHTVELTQLPSQ